MPRPANSARWPGPPPVGWAGRALALVVGTAVIAGLLVLAGWLTQERPTRFFGEWKIGTLISCALLIAAGVVCLRIRRELAGQRFGRFWLGLGVLLIYLALDDLLKIHEGLDRLINAALGLHPKGTITDRVDDAIVAIYGLIAVSLALIHRRRLLRLPWTVLTLAAAFACFGAMVVLDTLHRYGGIEDPLKLVANALLLSAVLAAKAETAAEGPAVRRDGILQPAAVESVTNK